MSTTTTNLNLTKPDSSDYVDISVINDNYDAIDTFAGSVLNGNYVTDANYVHTDNNFTTTLKNKLDGVAENANNYSLPTASTSTLGGVKVDGTTVTIDGNGVISSTAQGGTTVVANPEGTATASLESLQVGNIIYSASGGGTTVVANPSGSKTADLTKLQVGNDIYGVPTNIDDLSDVTISSVADAQVLQYDSTAGKWKNANAGGTTVVANPVGIATDDLETVQIGNVIYSIPEGGGGSGLYSGKTLVKKTKTYTGDGTTPLVITFTEKPLLIYDIYGPGLNETNTVRMYPFTYGETKTAGRYINNDSTSGMIGYTITYSNNDLTMSITSNPIDAGACCNNNGSTYTIEYLVENDLNKFTDVTGTLTAGSTSITLSDASITITSTIEVFNDLDVPYNSKTLSTGSITLTFDAQQSDMSVKVRVS